MPKFVVCAASPSSAMLRWYQRLQRISRKVDHSWRTAARGGCRTGWPSSAEAKICSIRRSWASGVRRSNPRPVQVEGAHSTMKVLLLLRGRVGPGPDPACRGVAEVPAERREHLARAQPHVPVVTRGERRPERRGVPRAELAADALGGDDEVGLHLAGTVDHLVVDEVDAQLLGPLGEDVLHDRAVDRVAVATTEVHGRVVVDADLLAVPPADGGPEPAPGGGIVGVDLVEQLVAPRDSPAVGGARLVPLDHGDVMAAVTKLRQDCEVHPRRATAHARDLHCRPSWTADGGER